MLFQSLIGPISFLQTRKEYLIFQKGATNNYYKFAGFWSLHLIICVYALMSNLQLGDG